MGVGSNRMNIYTVGMATQGFANYLKKNFADREQISVVVCHDCRNNSRLFAETVADIFSANGIKVYLFDDMSQRQNVLLPYVTWDAKVVLTLLLAITPKSIMDIKLIGQMAHKYWHLTTKAL